jgi:predicted P-loop ATPase
LTDYAERHREQQAADLKGATLAVMAKRASDNACGDPDWRSRLIFNGAKRPTPKSVLANAITALRYSPEWWGALAYDEFALRVVPVKHLPWGAVKECRWTDNDDRLTTDWLHHQGIFVSVETAGLAIQTVAMESRFHPVRQYLNALKWDGVARVEHWLNRYAGAAPTKYSNAVGQCTLVAAVSRIYRPGGKADNVAILQAKQGALKSTLVKTLAGEWFTDEIADLGSKDSAMQTAGVWLVELSELDSMSRSESGKIKAFISRTTDRFRPPTRGR